MYPFQFSSYIINLLTCFVLNDLFNVFATLLERNTGGLCDFFLFVYFWINSHLLQIILLKKFKLIIFSIF